MVRNRRRGSFCKLIKTVENIRGYSIWNSDFKSGAIPAEMKGPAMRHWPKEKKKKTVSLKEEIWVKWGAAMENFMWHLLGIY